ncbi:MAG TPA: glutaredoxin family protein [Solirubrobacteraceae bacterium]|jgi:glutaredoxin
MSVVMVYSREGCHLCEEAVATLRRLQPELGFDLAERDIDADESLQRAYFERVPVIALDGEELSDFFVDEAALRERLESRR